MKTIRKLIVVLGTIAVLAGCATPETRVRKSPELFNRLTPEQQTLIRAGKVGVGFDKAMVKLALGEPDQVRERTNAAGTVEIWQYVSYESRDGMVLFTGHHHRGWIDRYQPYYLAESSYRGRAHATVLFTDGKVTAFEVRK